MASPVAPDFLKPTIDFKNIEWTIVDSVTDIQDEFLALLEFQNIKFKEFQLIEKFTSNAKTQFVCAFINTSPILLFPIQEIWLSKANFPGFKRNFWQRLASVVIDFSCLNLLFSGSLLHIDKSYLTYDTHQISALEAYRIHFEIILSLRKEKSYAAQMVHLSTSFAKKLEVSFQSWGFEQPLPDYEMQLNLRNHWLSWEAYLADLSKKYAVRATKIKAAAASLEIKFLDDTEIKKLETEIQSLYLQTIKKQEVLLTQASQGYFAALKEIYKDAFQVKGIFKEEKLLAFYTWFEYEDSIEMHFIGLDYKHNTEHQLYFNILFEGMLDGIALGKKSVLYGRTSLEAKASLGAVAIPSSSYLRLGMVNSCITDTLQNYISKLENPIWKERNPLKIKA